MTPTPLSRLSLLIGLLLTLQPVALQAAVDERPRGVQLLEKYQLGANNEGLAKALRWLHGADTPPGTLSALVEQLGHSEFNKREDATKELSTLGMVPAILLEEARHSKSPEISSRAKRIIEARVPLERDRPQIFLTIFARVAAGRSRSDLQRKSLHRLLLRSHPLPGGIRQGHDSSTARRPRTVDALRHELP